MNIENGMKSLKLVALNVKKRPNFNFEEQKTPIYCSDCKLENMIDVVNKDVLYVIKKHLLIIFR